MSFGLGIRIGIGAQFAGNAEPPIITATVTPALGALADGDQVQDALAASATQAGNYASTEGTIQTPVATVLIDGSPGSLTDTVSAGEVVSVTITVSDNAANSRLFSAGSQTVAAVAPVASNAIADQTYTNGSAITPLDVAADFTGTAPITYALAPSSAALPAGLSLSSAGELTGTPTADTAQVNIVVRGTNSEGSADTAFGVTVQAAAETDPPVINSQDYNDTTKEVTLDLTDASPPITVVWGSIANPNTATKSDLLNGTGDVLENGSFTATTGSTSTEIDVTDETADEIHYYLIDDAGNETAIQIITGVTIDSTAAVLTNVVDEADGQTAATWGVTSDTAAGTIYAGLRLSSNPKLTATEIINTTGNCLQTDTDATPTADANNGGAFSGLTAGTGYTVDTTQDDGFGNITVSVAGDGFTTISDADAADYISRGITNGGGTPNAAVQTAIDDLFIGLKSDNLLSEMGAACLLSAWPNLAGLKTPLLSSMPTPDFFNFGAGDYDPETGLKGNGTDAYILSNFVLSDFPALTDAFMAVYVTDAQPATGVRYMGGRVDADTPWQVFVSGASASDSIRMWIGGTGANDVVVANAAQNTGLVGVSRNGTTLKGFAGAASNTDTNTATGTPGSEDIGIYANYVTGAASNHTASRFDFYCFGGFMDDTLLAGHLAQFETDLAAALP